MCVCVCVFVWFVTFAFPLVKSTSSFDVLTVGSTFQTWCAAAAEVISAHCRQGFCVYVTSLWDFISRTEQNSNIFNISVYNERGHWVVTGFAWLKLTFCLSPEFQVLSGAVHPDWSTRRYILTTITPNHQMHLQRLTTKMCFKQPCWSQTRVYCSVWEHWRGSTVPSNIGKL